jgi:ABC-type taurine transport system ATPase subunit
VYADADVVLLDDPLSAVDSHVGRALFEECIRGVLRAKTVLLVTNALQVPACCCCLLACPLACMQVHAIGWLCLWSDTHAHSIA